MSDKIPGRVLYREMTFDRAAMDVDARTISLAFSSEAPVERWFGPEILDHSPASIRLGRLSDGGPLLMDHNPTDQVGVVEKVDIGSDRVGRAIVRFGRSARAEEIYQDVVDGIRSKISVGYMIHKMESEKSGGVEMFRAVDWEPHEISIVAVPADASVGIGRSDVDAGEIELIRSEPSEKAIIMETENVVTPAAAPVVDTRAIVDEVRTAELKRIADLEKIGGYYPILGGVELARDAINTGMSVEQLQAAILERAKAKKLTEASGDIGMSQKEVRKFSFLRALNALANPGDRKAQEAAAFEREASEAAARVAGKSAQGIMVPADVLRRDLVAGTPTAGGNLVATDLLTGSFIDILRNKAIIVRAGARTLNGLVGNIAIPKLTGAATAYWVAESGAPAESQQTIGQVTMTPKTVGAYTEFSRRLMLQSSLDVESMVRSDLAQVMALAIDSAALYGTGANNQPTGVKLISGINTVDPAAATPTFAEVVAMESAVAADNADVGTLAYLVNAAMRGALKSTEKFSGTGQTIWEPGNTINGYRAEVSNQIATNDLFFGNWADVLIGFWSGLDLMVDPYSNSTSGTVRVVALQDVDIAARNAVSFCYANKAIV